MSLPPAMTLASETEPTPATPPAPSALPSLEKLARGLLTVAVVLGLAVVMFSCLRPIAVTDFWWQAKTGELIVQTGSIPTRDPFSWTANGEPWLVHEWLTEVFFYLAFVHLPNWVLLLYKSGLAVLACALVLARAWLRSGSVALAVGAAVAAGLVMRNYADVRPQMVTFVLLAALLLALDEYRSGRLRRLPWAVPVVFVLWANLHGGVIVGLILITLWATGEALSELLGSQSPRLSVSDETLRLLAGLLVSYGAVCLNPNGVHVYAYPFQVLGHPRVIDYITEWWSPNFHFADMRPFGALLVVTLAVLALAPRQPGEVRWGEVLILGAMGYAALMIQRNSVAFGLAAAPAVAEGLGRFWRDTPGLRALREAASAPALRAAGAAILLAVLCLLVYRYLPYETPGRRLVPPERWFAYGINLETFPRQAVARMDQGAWPGRLYNDYVWGGYLIWKLYPRRPVFIDGRAEVYYPSKTFDDEMTIHQVATGWLAALDRRGVEVVLTRSDGYLGRALPREPGWRLVFTGRVESVFVRAGTREPIRSHRRDPERSPRAGAEDPERNE